MNSSVLWITSAASARTGGLIGSLRECGLLPVRVDSVDDALRLLQQFRAGVVVHHGAALPAVAECARLAATKSPVVAVVRDIGAAQGYLSAGCAAVVADTCPNAVFSQLLHDVACGKRSVMWPERPAGHVDRGTAIRPSAT